MLYIAAVLEAVPGKEKKLENVLKQIVPKVADEEGAVIYSLHKSLDNPLKFTFYELYKDEEAIEKHMETPYFKQLLRDIDGLYSAFSIDKGSLIEFIKPKTEFLV